MKHIFCIFLISSLSMSMSRRSSSSQRAHANFNITLSQENLRKLEQRESVLEGQLCEVSAIQGTSFEPGDLGCFITNLSLTGQRQTFTGTHSVNLSALGINDPMNMISKLYIFKTQNNCWFLITNNGFQAQSTNGHEEISLIFLGQLPEVNCPDYANTESRESGKGVESDDSNIQVSPSPSRAISN